MERTKNKARWKANRARLGHPLFPNPPRSRTSFPTYFFFPPSESLEQTNWTSFLLYWPHIYVPYTILDLYSLNVYSYQRNNLAEVLGYQTDAQLPVVGLLSAASAKAAPILLHSSAATAHLTAWVEDSTPAALHVRPQIRVPVRNYVSVTAQRFYWLVASLATTLGTQTSSRVHHFVTADLRSWVVGLLAAAFLGRVFGSELVIAAQHDCRVVAEGAAFQLLKSVDVALLNSRACT